MLKITNSYQNYIKLDQKFIPKISLSTSKIPTQFCYESVLSMTPRNTQVDEDISLRKNIDLILNKETM